MKTYVLMVSRVFPQTHKNKGKETYFPYEILIKRKIHTIRSNFDLWDKRIKEIQEGKAILSLRYWNDKPYRSKQVEICKLDKDSGIGVQALLFGNLQFYFPLIGIDIIDLDVLSENDGLSFDDFAEWFKKYDLSKPMAIIHFTKFRY